MGDIIDLASTVETTLREAAIAAACAPPHYPQPDTIDGVPCCAECGEPIPAARLAAMPGCGLCVGCAEEWLHAIKAA